MRRTCRRCRQCSNIELDYDKLAEAIVKANRMAEEKSDIPEPIEKLGLKRSLQAIFSKKVNTNGKFLSSAMALFSAYLFRVIAGFGVLFFGTGIYVIYGYCTNMNWRAPYSIVCNIMFVIFLVSLLLIVVLFSMVMFGAAKEIEQEKDKHYIVDVFSGVIGVLALIVALVTLLKGVIR